MISVRKLLAWLAGLIVVGGGAAVAVERGIPIDLPETISPSVETVEEAVPSTAAASGSGESPWDPIVIDAAMLKKEFTDNQFRFEKKWKEPSGQWVEVHGTISWVGNYIGGGTGAALDEFTETVFGVPAQASYGKLSFADSPVGERLLLSLKKGERVAAVCRLHIGYNVRLWSFDDCQERWPTPVEPEP